MQATCLICGKKTITAIVNHYYTPYCQNCHFFDFDHKLFVEGVEISLNAKELSEYKFNDLIMFNQLELVSFLKLGRRTRNDSFTKKDQNAIDLWVHVCQMLEQALIYRGWNVPERIYNKTISKLAKAELTRK